MKSRVRLNGIDYQLKLTKQRQILDGVERDSIVDHDRRKVYFSRSVRRLIAMAVAEARRTMPIPEPSVAFVSVPVVECSREQKPATVPATLSGCYPVQLHRWPWWKNDGRPLRPFGR